MKTYKVCFEISDWILKNRRGTKLNIFIKDYRLSKKTGLRKELHCLNHETIIFFESWSIISHTGFEYYTSLHEYLNLYNDSYFKIHVRTVHLCQSSDIIGYAACKPCDFRVP